jgi:hypothetical protein
MWPTKKVEGQRAASSRVASFTNLQRDWPISRDTMPEASTPAILCVLRLIPCACRLRYKALPAQGERTHPAQPPAQSQSSIRQFLHHVALYPLQHLPLRWTRASIMVSHLLEDHFPHPPAFAHGRGERRRRAAATNHHATRLHPR